MSHIRNFSAAGSDADHASEGETLNHYSQRNSNHSPYRDSPISSPTHPTSSFPDQHHHVGHLPATPRRHPAAHPDSNFQDAQRARTYGVDGPGHRGLVSSSNFINHHDQHPDSPTPPPPPPPLHRQSLVGRPVSGGFAGHHFDPDHNQEHRRSTRSGPLFAVGTDNYGDPRLSQWSMDQEGMGSTNPRSANAPWHQQQGSYSSSILPIAGGAATPGSMTPIIPPSESSRQSLPLHDYPSRHSFPSSPFHDSPYQSSSMNLDSQVGHTEIDPHNIADDGDDGFMPKPNRKSVLGRMGPQHADGDPSSPTAARSGHGVGRGGAAAAAAGGATTGGIMGTLAGLAGRKPKGQTLSTEYDPVTQAGQAEGGGAEGSVNAEKGVWLSGQTKGNRKRRWKIGFVIGALVILAIVGAVLGGVLGSRANGGGGSGGGRGSSPGASINNADDDLAANGDLDKDSAEIQALMDDPDLHKVFPAMDYTPWGVQYPDCVTYPPSQNNITRDMAVLSQLSNVVRLYGTDCNQTEMVLHSIDQLGLDDMKVWLGVWIGDNQTTNDRQLEKMYQILEDTSDHSIFKGVIVGNEALYRAGKDKPDTKRELIQVLSEVRSNFTSLKYDLPITTSDLGDNWDAELVRAVDVIMSNIHPFFAGTPVEDAAGWTWDFWQNKNTPLTKGKDIPQIISETGWPSGGGTDCGKAKCATDESGAVAGVEEMNTFMGDFVCQALENGTDYFWFEAFDEPWKVEFNEPGQEWEDKWGLMDAGRKLKPGLKIPDCGGKTPS